MLGLLSELRSEAGADVEVPEKPPSEPSEKELPDIAHLEFVDTERALYKEIREDDGAMVQACEEVRRRVENMEEIVQLVREALLPSKLAQLANRFESQELLCQRMIRRAKELLITLRGDDEDHDEDDIAAVALQPVRQSIAQVRAKQFKALVQAFFVARSHNRTELVERGSRQLRFAYPEALPETLDEIMEFPELAFDAIALRLESGSEATLDVILGQTEGKKADTKKLEQGAKELKLMFLQFEQLIDVQGEQLTEVEENIQIAMEEVSEAIGILTDAETEKRAYERKKLKFFLVGGLLVFYFFIWPFCHGDKSSDWGIVNVSSRAYRSAFHKILPDQYKRFYGDDESAASGAKTAETPKKEEEAAKTAEAPKKEEAKPEGEAKASLLELSHTWGQGLQGRQHHGHEPPLLVVPASSTIRFGLLETGADESRQLGSEPEVLGVCKDLLTMVEEGGKKPGSSLGQLGLREGDPKTDEEKNEEKEKKELKDKEDAKTQEDDAKTKKLLEGMNACVDEMVKLSTELSTYREREGSADKLYVAAIPAVADHLKAVATPAIEDKIREDEEAAYLDAKKHIATVEELLDAAKIERPPKA